MKKTFALSLFFACASMTAGTHAATVSWMTGKTIKSVNYFWDGANDVVQVEFNEPLTTGCPTQDAARVVNYWFPGIHEVLKIRYAVASTAMLTGRPVDVPYESSMACDATYGRKFQGIRFSAP